MLIIRKEQKAAMLAGMRRNYPETVMRYVREKLPEQAQALGDDEFEKFVHESIARAGEYEVKIEWDLCRFVYLDLLYGPEFDTTQAWAESILATEGLSATDKIDRLESYYRNYLQE